NGKQAIRVVFETQSKAVIGFNLMGIRYRHEVCDKWIREKTPIEKVIKKLKKANFDPEFHNRYEKEIQKTFKAIYS
ncbi:MAG: NAD(P)/FAD-dependent oxidoreductase, partial [Bacteroidia bacterium]